MITVEEILELLRSEVETYENPGSYCESEWYDKCRAKAEILNDLIYIIESRNKSE
jgi:hypothetical protein